MRSLTRSVLGLLPAVLSWRVQHLPRSLGSHASGTSAELGDLKDSRTQTPGWTIIHRLFFFFFFHQEHISPDCSWPELLRQTSHSAPWPGSNARTTTQQHLETCNQNWHNCRVNAMKYIKLFLQPQLCL